MTENPEAESTPVAVLNRLFITALVALAKSGNAEEACRLAAEGWSKLRRDLPHEAERLNAALHGLVHFRSSSQAEKESSHG
ncbi:MAG: hypothetical protein K6U10_00275 [Acidobacteriia bacterium]|nr:hypothetical protein [Methyloceanibacter sp.]MBX5473244.1 hypothetical protein [Acetobacteraceae bacterium]MCL6490238.1 hypothetical protein [Terriglobia bacterium]